MIRTHFIFLVANLFGALCTVSATPTDDPSFGHFIDAEISAAMDANGVLGGVAVIVDGGEITHLKGYGFRDLDRSTPIGPERDLFRVASVTKVFTGLLASDLMERGLLDLDVPIDKVGGQARQHTFRHPVTLRQLLTHSAGFEEAGLEFYDGSAPPKGDDAEPLGAFLARTAPGQVFEPDTVRAYSNYGYALIAHLIASAGSAPYADQLQTRVLRPLEMNRSTAANGGELVEKHFAPGYIRRGDGLVKAPLETVRGVGSAGLSTTAPDMARFMIAMMAPKPAADDEAPIPYAVRRRLFEPLRTEHPAATQLAAAAWIDQRGDQLFVSHGGDGVGYVALVLMEPALERGVFIAFNTSAFGAIQDVESAILQRWSPTPPVIGVPLPDDFDAALGEYHGSRRAFTHFGIMATLFGDAVSELSRVDDTTIRVGGRSYIHEGDLVFRSQTGAVLAFVSAPGERPAYLARGTQIFTKASATETLSTRWVVGGGLLLLCLALAIFGGVRARSNSAPSQGLAVAATAIAAGTCVAVLGSVAMVGADPIDWQFGVPPGVRITLALALVLPAAALTTVIVAINTWMRGAEGRLYASLSLFAVTGLTIWMHSHGLVGWRFA
ncbi:MAG: serine hydrolase domain-containing protein [Pseudomonadota bacterium]